MTRFACMARWFQCLALLATAAFAAPAQSDVDLRVVARPIADPIRIFVRVSTAGGVPIEGLQGSDFGISLDGTALSTATFALPPAQDPTQRASIIFAMDYSSSVTDIALTAMQDAVNAFIAQMVPGDYAAILKFNDTNPDGASIVQPFTAIDDGGAGDVALNAAVMAPYPGDFTNIMDAVNLAVDTFLDPGVALPNGPKAIILVSDGGENSSDVSQSEAVAHANNNGLPVFTIGVGDIASSRPRRKLLEFLAENTGGEFFPAPDDQSIADAYVTVAASLNNEYVLTIPADAITDCDTHRFEVIVPPHDPARISFSRCDVTPEDFTFTDAIGVAPGAVITSDIATIVGIDTPVPIEVTRGEYSIGCGAAFTSAPGMIDFGETVCVRHTSSTRFSTEETTVLIVGGVSGTFTSTTRAEPPPSGNGGGGGGATGVLELLLGLGALFGARRRRA